MKKQDGALSPRQREWRDALQKTGARYYMWKPSDWPTVQRILFGEVV